MAIHSFSLRTRITSVMANMGNLYGGATAGHGTNNIPGSDAHIV